MPEACVRFSQAALALRLHDNVPPVGFVRLISCAAGAVPPATPEKLSAVGLSDMLGVADVVPVTVRVTGIAVRFLWPFSPSIAMTTVVEYVPVERPVKLMLIVSWSRSVEIVPDDGDIVTQGDPDVADQFLVRSLPFQNVMVCDGGVASPCVPEKLRADGLVERAQA